MRSLRHPLHLPLRCDTPDLIYLHGSIRSRALQHLATGAPVRITITFTDGLVFSRKPMNHSMNYRSVTLFGAAQEVTHEREKFDLFDRMVQRYFPGSAVGHDYGVPPPADPGVTALVEVKIEEGNAKARRGNPTGPDDDKPDAMGPAGVIDLREP